MSKHPFETYGEARKQAEDTYDKVRDLVSRVTQAATHLSSWESPDFPGFCGRLSDGDIIRGDTEGAMRFEPLPTLEEIHRAREEWLKAKSREQHLYDQLSPDLKEIFRIKRH